MKKIFTVLLILSLLVTVIPSYALDLGGFGNLLDTLTEDDPDVQEVLNDITDLLTDDTSSASDKAVEEDDSLPSLVGPFSGGTVKVKINNRTYTLHEEFKDAMDKYEAFFDAYIEFMADVDSPDYMSRYLDFMQKYTEVMQAMEKLDNLSDSEKGWSDDESAYYTYVSLEIDKKLYASLETGD